MCIRDRRRSCPGIEETPDAIFLDSPFQRPLKAGQQKQPTSEHGKTYPWSYDDGHVRLVGWFHSQQFSLQSLLKSWLGRAADTEISVNHGLGLVNPQQQYTSAPISLYSLLSDHYRPSFLYNTIVNSKWIRKSCHILSLTVNWRSIEAVYLLVKPVRT